MLFKKLIKVPILGTRIIRSGYLIQAATITGRSTRGEPLKLKKPFPYENKKFYFFNEMFDPTIVRVAEENAKIIVVEGPIGVGKTAFCEALAEQFDMKYFPQPTMDEFYILPSGLDIRQFDDQLPEEIRTYDHRNFCINPCTFKAGLFQVYTYYLKFHQYIHAFCHLLNTGQGVVLERSYLSDYVFMRAMLENKFVPPVFSDIYFTIKENTSTFFAYPHLIIYLDIPVPVVHERIKTRNYSYEQNSPALTNNYLTCLEKYWKTDYLRQASKNSDILIYDWSDGGNIDVVVDDIENIDFDIMRADRKFTSWWMGRNFLYKYRCRTTNEPFRYDKYFVYPWYRVDEVFDAFQKSSMWYDIFIKIPECRYTLGYNPRIGDSKFKILFNLVKPNLRKAEIYLPKSFESMY